MLNFLCYANFLSKRKFTNWVLISQTSPPPSFWHIFSFSSHITINHLDLLHIYMSKNERGGPSVNKKTHIWLEIREPATTINKAPCNSVLQVSFTIGSKIIFTHSTRLKMLFLVPSDISENPNSIIINLIG